jgi:hypothetical protein
MTAGRFAAIGQRTFLVPAEAQATFDRASDQGRDPPAQMRATRLKHLENAHLIKAVGETRLDRDISLAKAPFRGMDVSRAGRPSASDLRLRPATGFRTDVFCDLPAF